MNTPYNTKDHWPALKDAAPGLKADLPNPFSTYCDNPQWQRVSMPWKQGQAFDDKCAQLGIFAGVDTSYSHEACRMLAKYVRVSTC